MPATVDIKAFSDILENRSLVLRELAQRVLDAKAENFTLTRPLLNIIQSESSQLEELLDAYHAKNNTQWYCFRLCIATLKNFSSAGYELVHLKHACRGYDFHSLHGNFLRDTQNAIHYVSSLLYCSLNRLLELSGKMGWEAVENLGMDFSEELPEGHLPRDRQVRHIQSSQERVIKLATNFLNSTEDARFLQAAARAKGPKWKSLNFEQLNEVSIRAEEGRFHNLQSQYDTYISDSDTEKSDEDLRKLRGHISSVLHLLRVTTIFIHVYERHFIADAEQIFSCKKCALTGDWFLNILTHYLAKYCYEFLESARDLCQKMLKRYAVIDTIEVSIPPFFGFHVRPSTLISTIVHHYGSEVKMILDKEYDAGATMNLFLANEWINQLKRNFVFDELGKMDLQQYEDKIAEGEISVLDGVLRVIRELAGRQVIRILNYPLPIEDLVNRTRGTLLEICQAVIVYMHAHRLMTIPYEIKVKFQGDVRVLDDIRLLAENGYGENEFGANIALPAQLDYLQYTRKNS